MINSNIPMPPRTKNQSFPWDKMQIGDSVDVPITRCPSLRTQFRKKGWGFVSTVKGTDEFPLAAGYARVWRAEDVTPTADEPPTTEEAL